MYLLDFSPEAFLEDYSALVRGLNIINPQQFLKRQHLLKLYRNLSSLALSMSIISAGASIRSAADDQYIEWKSASGEVASDLRNQVESKDLISTTLFSVGGFSVVIPYYIFEKKIQFLESELYNWENFIYVKK